VTEASPKRRSKKRRPDLDTVYSINPDGSRNYLHPADVKGRWTTRANLFYWLLIAIYMGLPWLKIEGQPAVFIDLPGRQAHFFGLAFTNQDFYLSFFLFTGLGFALFVATALFGRVWCGFACPQTVFLEGVFRRVERWIEGPRVERIRRNMGPMTVDKAWRKALKHGLFLVFSLAIAHTFLAYFMPVSELRHALRSSPAHHPAAFGWTMFWTAILYFDYSWFREQTCLIICPYGRLQSALIDADTIVIGYDKVRGEPRSKGIDKGGDCVDCFRCVEVCPTGIDIRNGLQMECISCTRCIDACDEVMRRIEKPEGLIRFDSTRVFEGDGRRPFFRPRVFVYILLGLIGLGAATFAFSHRENFAANVLRTRGMPYTLEEQRIRNLYTLHVQNKSGEPATYFLRPGPDKPDSLRLIIGQKVLRLGPLEDEQTPVFAYLPRSQYHGEGAIPFSVAVVDSATGEEKLCRLKFRGP